jgi:hypothetical protein
MNNPTPYTKEYYDYFNKIKMCYKSCNICGNEMTLIKSVEGNYYVCKVCNNVTNTF